MSTGIGRFPLFLTAAAFAATSAFAGRYWVAGNDSNALFSNTANWSGSKDGAGGATVPDSGTSTTYWYKYQNGRTVFDSAAVVSGAVRVSTGGGSYFTWDVKDGNGSYGLTASGQDFILGDNAGTSYSPASLKINGGTYSFGTTRIGGVANAVANMEFNGGDFTTSKLRIGGYEDSTKGTLTVKGGTMRTTLAAADAFQMCLDLEKHNSSGTVVVDGGTLDVSSSQDMQMGGTSNATILVHVKSGELIGQGMLLGGQKHKTAYAVDNAVSRLVVDGGTFTLNCSSGHEGSLGFATGSVSYAEMVVNGGDVNCNWTSFYVAEAGPATLTMNGGTFTTQDGSYGLTLGRAGNGHDVATVNLNGGVLTIRKFRLDYVQPGSRITFNGGTVKPTRAAPDFLEENANLTCEVQAGGLVVDTAGFNITIAHDIVGSGPLVKKGAGKLTFTGSTPFTSANTTVEGGSVSIAQSTVDGSSGGYLGEMVLHGSELDGWLKDSDFTTYSSTYGAKGTASLERPNTVKVKVNGQAKTYENLEVGITTNDTFNGVSYSFSTENVAPRTMKVVSTVNNKSVANVRDVGSWPLLSVDGTKKMNQGVIFRGGHLDHFAGATAEQKAASALAGLKTEIDLRHVDSDTDISAQYQTSTFAVEKSWAAVDALYYPCPMDYNKGCTQISTSDAMFTNQVRRMFSRLGTPGALPAYFHCRIGTDRTGITGMLLLGMMGVDEECLYRDYLMSNFANIGGSRDPGVPDTFLRYIHRGNCNSGKYVYSNNSYGKSVAARCRAYLEMCGVTYSEISNITTALSGETPEEVLARVDAYEAANGVRTVSYLPVKGSSDTNAVHRLPAGRHILPRSTPTRDHYVFAGWDTENEVDNGDGTATVYAKWEVSGYVRLWADGNGAAESIARYASWNPAPDQEKGFMSGDTLVINRGADKVATLSADDSVTVENVYVGWGTLDGTNFDYHNDRGGRLDVSGGTLYATKYFYVGGESSDRSNNVVNVTGGRVRTGSLRTGRCSSNGGKKCDTLNISGTGVFEAGISDTVTLARSSSGLSYVNVTNGGTFASAKQVNIGHAGEAHFLLDGGTATIGASAVIGSEANSIGTLHVVSGTFNVADGAATRVGNKGRGTLTIDGGTVNAGKELKLSTEGGAAGSELNLNGGRLNVGQFATSATELQTMNWNGGTLSCNGQGGSTFFAANANVAVNVLAGGAVYETFAGRDSATDVIAQPMSGAGAFVKRGGGTLSLTGALDLKGGFKVEGGTLSVSSLSRTYFDEISVDAGCTLNLNGSSVTVVSYKAAGAAKDPGTYSECNGTITVLSSDITVADGTYIDFCGESLTFDTIKGSGTISNADVTVTGTVEPGLTVGGTMTFAPGAKIDVTPCDAMAVGTRVVFLTAESIENWPALVSSGTRKAELSLVDNGDGTVSLVGTLATPSSDGRYWLGNNYYWSDTDNWSETSGGTKGASVPGSGATGITYWRNYRNGRTVFDAAATIPDGAYVGTGSADFFVWDATDPSYGFTTANNHGLRVGGIDGKSPTYLQIDGGTYSAPYLRLGYANNVVVGLTVNGGTLTFGRVRVGGGQSGVNGTLTLRGGTLTTTNKSTVVFMVCDQPNTVGRLVIDGGMLDTRSADYVEIGGVENTDAYILLKSGTWRTASFLVGGKLKVNGTPASASNAVARLVVDGGTLEASANCCIGSTIGTGTLSEMIVSNGVVNINADNLYVGECGPGSLVMEGGELNIRSSESYGLALGHNNNNGEKYDVATVTLNGGTVTAGRIRLTYVKPGSRVVFNGGTLRATRTTTGYIDANENLTCEVADGGLVFDTAGFDVTIAHDIVLADGATAPQLIKKGGGRLTISGSTPFTAENIFVCEGSVKFKGKTYNVNVGTNFVTTTGGDLGVVVIHGETLESWLNDPDFATYSSVYGAKGTTMLEQPLGVVVEVDGRARGYINLETGKTYNDTLNGVSYSFTTEDHAPRTMKVISPVTGSAIINIRDVGSWPIVSVDGKKKMNQGVIFRGGKLDSFVNSTAEQRASSVLAGLKSEIDLRKLSELDPGYTNVTKSWAAVDANYYHFSYVDATQLDATDSGNFTNQVRNVFSTLGTPGALPAYFHCVIGTDRTGITGRLLLGLMGVEEEVIYRDYLMSNFANIGGSRSPDVTEKTLRHLLRGNCNSGKYVYNTKDGTYGASVASRCRQYLEMCGVTSEEISNITMALSGETADEVLARVNAYEAANGVRTVSYVPYPGSSDTNAIHRLPAGSHIYPTSTPSRNGYVFMGWDTDNEANGIVYATWKKKEVRYWADSNGATESFSRAESWDPAPVGDFAQDDILVVNKGIDKTALLSEGSVVVDTLYVGWGSFDGGANYISSSDTSDRCGRLDVVDGLLNVTNYLYVGGYRTTKNISSTVNVSGGRVMAGRLYVGDYSTTGNRCDAFNISGTGVVEVTSGEIWFASEYDSGGAVASLYIGDSGVLRGYSDARFGKYGRATAVLEDNATLDVSGQTVYLANGGGTYGGLSLAGSSSLLFYDMWVGYSASSTGSVVVVDNGSIAASHYIYIGRKGVGNLTINSGVVSLASAIQFGVDGASGNDTVLNLNGGKLITRQMKVLGSPNAVFNWNGGVLEYSAASGDSTADIMPDSALVVNVCEGGAIYNAVVRSNEQINHPLSGVGALTKTGAKQLTVSGAVDLAGGFVVEEGKLTLSNVVGTEFAQLSVADGATLDLSDASVTVSSCRGSGMVSNADVAVTGTVEPGLTVGGVVTFGPGARFDLAPLGGTALGTRVVFLTATSIVNAPPRASSSYYRADLSLVDNGDGTVSLVGALRPQGQSVILR